jgi:hypothetical protein
MELRQKWGAFYEAARQNPFKSSHHKMHLLDILTDMYENVPKY